MVEEEVDKCPNCDIEMTDVNDLLVKKVRDAGVLLLCENCGLLFGRLT